MRQYSTAPDAPASRPGAKETSHQARIPPPSTNKSDAAPNGLSGTNGANGRTSSPPSVAFAEYYQSVLAKYPWLAPASIVAVIASVAGMYYSRVEADTSKKALAESKLQNDQTYRSSPQYQVDLLVDQMTKSEPVYPSYAFGQKFPREELKNELMAKVNRKERVVLLDGGSGRGKSTFAMEIVADARKRGNPAIYISAKTEQTYVQLEHLVVAVKESFKKTKKPVIVVVDDYQTYKKFNAAKAESLCGGLLDASIFGIAHVLYVASEGSLGSWMKSMSGHRTRLVQQILEPVPVDRMHKYLVDKIHLTEADAHEFIKRFDSCFVRLIDFTDINSDANGKLNSVAVRAAMDAHIADEKPGINGLFSAHRMRALDEHQVTVLRKIYQSPSYYDGYIPQPGDETDAAMELVEAEILEQMGTKYVWRQPYYALAMPVNWKEHLAKDVHV